ncbi:hypothetical protein LTR17_003351, partial [Elasticomyces elasticus]
YDRGHLLTQAYPEYWRRILQLAGNNDLAHGVIYSVPHVSPPRTDRSSSLKRKATKAEVPDDDDKEDEDDIDIPDAILAKAKKPKDTTTTGGTTGSTTSPGGTRKKATPRKSGRLNK